MNKENYLLKKPCRKDCIAYKTDENGMVTLSMENKGIVNFLFQLIFKKPKISYIHLDEMGSFIWPILSGSRDILEIGKEVKEKFGEEAEPLYERLSRYIKTLESYGFITLN